MEKTLSMKDNRKTPCLKLGISACLLGKMVRYDGGHKRNRFLCDMLGLYVKYIPVCPEVECGLPVPREPMRLVGTPEAPRLLTINTRIDRTHRIVRWAEKRVRELEHENLCGFVFKSKSPSCGMEKVMIHTEKGTRVAGTGSGLFAAFFHKAFPHVPIEEEHRFENPRVKRRFIERISKSNYNNGPMPECETLFLEAKASFFTPPDD